MPNSKGLTLIEVLIALAILSIALTAVIKVTAQNIKDTLYLQNKTIATWVAVRVINEARSGILKLPAAPDQLERETTTLNQDWIWQGQLNSTPVLHVKEIDVNVALKVNKKNLVHLTGYLYVP